jgi:polysaccharide pyruvyl transferase WcaK-like protein
MTFREMTSSEARAGRSEMPGRVSSVKARKIAFYGLFGQQNWGNECTLQAILHNVRTHLPDAELMCVCSDPNDTSMRHDIRAFPVSKRHASGYRKVVGEQSPSLRRILRRVLFRIPMQVRDWVKAFKALKGCDMLVVPGTGLLTDFASNPFGGPYELFKWSVVAKVCRCKLLFVSVGAGPMYHPLTKWFIKSALRLAVYRSYRDRYSRQFLEGIGFKTTNDRVYPDLAFSLPRALFPEGVKRDSKRPVIGVGVKDYYGLQGLPERGGEARYRQFIEKLGSFATWLLENGYTVRLLIGDTLYDNSVKQDLMEVLRGRGVTNDGGQIIDQPISSGEDVLSQLAATDLVVSARFHNILLALMLNKPVIALSYNEKFAALVGGVGLGEYCHDIDHLDVGKLTAQVAELEKRAAEFRPHIEAKLVEYRDSLEQQYARIFADRPTVWD